MLVRGNRSQSQRQRSSPTWDVRGDLRASPACGISRHSKRHSRSAAVPRAPLSCFTKSSFWVSPIEPRVIHCRDKRREYRATFVFPPVDEGPSSSVGAPIVDQRSGIRARSSHWSIDLLSSLYRIEAARYPDNLCSYLHRESVQGAFLFF